MNESNMFEEWHNGEEKTSGFPEVKQMVKMVPLYI